MAHLTERLLAVEDDFLSALIAGEGAMSAFESRWENILEDVDAMSNSPDGLADETATLVHTISLRVATLAETSTSLFMSYETITSQLVDHIDSLMSDITIIDCSPQAFGTPSDSPASAPSPPRVRHEALSVDAPPPSRKRCRGSCPDQASKQVKRSR